MRLEDGAGCPRYLGRVIRGVNLAAQTPTWMKERLRRAGLRSIDPVVDVTNYVMVELGQPMHAFDLAVLQDAVVVRRARRGEKLLLLDGREVALDGETLLITDANGPIAIAGVMGGERSGISARHDERVPGVRVLRAARDRGNGAPLRTADRRVPTVRTRGGSRPAVRRDGASDGAAARHRRRQAGASGRYRLAGASAASTRRSRCVARASICTLVNRPTLTRYRARSLASSSSRSSSAATTTFGRSTCRAIGSTWNAKWI